MITNLIGFCWHQKKTVSDKLLSIKNYHHSPLMPYIYSFDFRDFALLFLKSLLSDTNYKHILGTWGFIQEVSKSGSKDSSGIQVDIFCKK